MKAQVAMEYMIIVSFALMILIPYFIYLQELSQNVDEGNTLTAASDSVNRIGQTADWVYSQGEPAKQEIFVYIPKNVVNMSFINKTINWRVKTTSGLSDVYYNSVANLVGSFPSSPGYYNLLIQASSGKVNISVSPS